VVILAVTANPAVDVTYHVDRLQRHRLTRVRRAHRQAGGKGVNVARALSCLGCKVRVTGLLGGASGASIRAELATLGVDDHMVEIRGETRHTVTIIEPSGAPTELSEPGPAITAADWSRLEDCFAGALEGVSVVTLSGSLPPGAPPDGYARLVKAAKQRGRAVVLDTSGAALVAALPSAPDVVTPNRREALAVLGAAETSKTSELLRACLELRRAGARAVVVTLGASGLVASAPEGNWRLRQRALSGNPVGAGDVLVAALARGLADGLAWCELLPLAASAAAASVLEDYAAQLSPERVQAQLSDVELAAIR
jgi:tagatose 6-phosphate kinase